MPRAHINISSHPRGSTPAWVKRGLFGATPAAMPGAQVDRHTDVCYNGSVQPDAILRGSHACECDVAPEHARGDCLRRGPGRGLRADPLGEGDVQGAGSGRGDGGLCDSAWSGFRLADSFSVRSLELGGAHAGGVEEGGLRIERELPDEDAAGAAEPAAKKFPAPGSSRRRRAARLGQKQCCARIPRQNGHAQGLHRGSAGCPRAQATPMSAGEPAGITHAFGVNRFGEASRASVGVSPVEVPPQGTRRCYSFRSCRST